LRCHDSDAPAVLSAAAWLHQPLLLQPLLLLLPLLQMSIALAALQRLC
jgi:hypothetical protein